MEAEQPNIATEFKEIITYVEFDQQALDAFAELKKVDIALLAEIGLDDYYYDDRHDLHIRSVTPEKLKPLTRPITINEKILLDCIYELRGVKIPYPDTFST